MTWVTHLHEIEWLCEAAQRQVRDRQVDDEDVAWSPHVWVLSNNVTY